MGRTLFLEIQLLVDDLHSSTDECMRPQPDGEKCIQCRERQRLIDKLEVILKTYRPVDELHCEAKGKR